MINPPPSQVVSTSKRKNSFTVCSLIILRRNVFSSGITGNVGYVGLELIILYEKIEIICREGNPAEPYIPYIACESSSKRSIEVMESV